jgi:hypothetical protein
MFINLQTITGAEIYLYNVQDSNVIQKMFVIHVDRFISVDVKKIKSFMHKIVKKVSQKRSFDRQGNFEDDRSRCTSRKI